MNTNKKYLHFAHNYLLQPTNPVMVNLIGAGGTGSQMLTALARMNYALRNLGHAGLQLSVFDDDRISEANLGRQLFSESELGLPKAVALINRINRFFGTNWKAVNARYNAALCDGTKAAANITISCVDTVQARFDIAAVLKSYAHFNGRYKPLYWMDFGNSYNTGQVVLSTINPITQPTSNKYKTVPVLPMITDEFKSLLEQQTDNDEPSCSLAEALDKQDLFINSELTS